MVNHLWADKVCYGAMMMGSTMELSFQGRPKGEGGSETALAGLEKHTRRR